MSEKVPIISFLRIYKRSIINKCIDFRAMVEPSMPLEYAKKHFAPALHPAIK